MYLILLLLACLGHAPRTATWSITPVLVNAPGSVCTDAEVQAAAGFWGLRVGTYPQAYAITVGAPTQRLSPDEVGSTWRYELTAEDGVTYVLRAEIEVWRCDDPRILAHEVGHGLGYGHGPAGTVMSPYLETVRLVRP